MSGLAKKIADPIGIFDQSDEIDGAKRQAEEAQRQAKAAQDAQSDQADFGEDDEELARRRRQAAGASILAPRTDDALGGTISRAGAQTLG